MRTRIRRLGSAATAIGFGFVPANAAAMEPTSAPPLASEELATADAGPVPHPSAPPVDQERERAGWVGGFSLGGGRIQDSFTGVAGVAADANGGFYVTPSFAVVAELGLMGRKLEDERSVSFVGGALLAEYRLVDPFWIAAGPGYYGFTLGRKPTEGEEADTEDGTGDLNLSGPGAQATLGLELYRGDSGFACHALARSQVAFTERDPLFTTLGLVGLRWYSRSGGQAVRAGEPGVASPSGFSLRSACPEPAQATLSGFALAARPCLHQLVEQPPSADFVLGFATKLLQGTRFGVWLGKALGIAQELGVGVEYDGATSSVRLRVNGEGATSRVLSKVVPRSSKARAFQIAQAASRVNVWLDDELLFSQPAPARAEAIAFKTSGAPIEIRGLAMQPLSPSQALAYSSGPLVGDEPSALSEPPPSVATEPSEPPTEPAPTRAAATTPGDLVRAYYADLNRGDFDAHRYFAPNVVRYISLRDLTPDGINHYVQKDFPRQFKNHQFRMVDEPVAATGEPGVFTFTEQVSYFNVAQQRQEDLLTLVRVRLDENGRIVEFWQSKVLKR